MARPHGIPDAQWRDWVWQMQERVRSAKDLERYINPTDDERRAIDALAERFRFVITPYYASLMDPDDPTCPIRKQVVPRTVELDDPAGLGDPLARDERDPRLPRPDRLLRQQRVRALRVRPYYCYQAQLLEGTAHFRVPVEWGVEIFRELRGRTSGFAIPTYVLDTPYGKVPLGYPYLRGRDGDHVVVEAWDGRIWRELNPV